MILHLLAPVTLYLVVAVNEINRVSLNTYTHLRTGGKKKLELSAPLV